MWHEKNNVLSRNGVRPTQRQAYKTTDIPRAARMCAMVVCLTTTWLVMSGIRYVFEADLEILPHDAHLFQFMYGDGTGQPTLGERLMVRNWGCAMLAKGVVDLCVTFGGSPPFTFTMLASFNVLVVWSLLASMLNHNMPMTFHSEMLMMCVMAAEAPCLYLLGGTNGVAEDDDHDHDRHDD